MFYREGSRGGHNFGSGLDTSVQLNVLLSEDQRLWSLKNNFSHVKCPLVWDWHLRVENMWKLDLLFWGSLRRLHNGHSRINDEVKSHTWETMFLLAKCEVNVGFSSFFFPFFSFPPYGSTTILMSSC